MSLMFAAIIEKWIEPDIVDVILESLALVGFAFLLVVLVYALRKAPMLTGHGSIEIIVFVVLGIVNSGMNVFTEFAWLTESAFKVWKIIEDTSLLLGMLILIIGFFRFFLFSARLFGEEPTAEE